MIALLLQHGMIVILAEGDVGRVLTLHLSSSLQFGVTLLIIEMVDSGCVTSEQMTMVLLVGWRAQGPEGAISCGCRMVTFQQ